MPRLHVRASLAALAVLCVALRPIPADPTSVPPGGDGEPAESAPAAGDRDPASEGPLLDERLAWIAGRVRTAMAQAQVPGLALSVVRNNEVVLSEAYGMRDLEAQLPATPETTFAIGTATRGFTATLVGWLMDRARMHWDDRVFKLVPRFRLKEPGATGAATVADLLSHRTGLMRGDLQWYAGTATPEQVLEACTRAEATAPFRAAWQENDSMYLVAGMAASSAGGDSWAVLLDEALLKPLGMSATATGRDAAAAKANAARGYARGAAGGLRPVVEPDPWNIAPAMAIRSSAVDLAEWVRFLLGRGRLGDLRLVSTERMEEAWRPQVPVPSSAVGGRPGVSSGLGWFVDQWGGRRRVFSPGGIDGFSALVSVLPDDGIGIAVLCNESATSLPATVESIVFRGLLNETLEPEGTAPAPVDGLAGRYWFEPLRDWITVAVRDGEAIVEIPGEAQQILLPPDERGRWRFASSDMLEAAFDRDDGGTARQMRLYEGAMEFELLREGVARTVEVTPDEAAPLQGHYQDDALGTAVEIRLDRGRLVLDVPGQMAFELHRPNADGWWVFRVSRSMAVAFARDETGQVTALRLMQRGREKLLPRVGGPLAPEPSEPLEALLARHRAAHGVAALPAQGSLRLVGTIDFVNQGVTGTCTVLAAGGDRLRQDIDLGPFGRSQLSYFDESFERRSSLAPRSTPSDHALRVERLANPLFPATLFDDAGRTMVVMGRTEENGRRLVGVALESGPAASGPRVIGTVWIDEVSGLCRRIEVPVSSRLEGAGRRSISLDDYRAVAGMQVPFRIEVEEPRLGRSVLVIDEARVDPQAGPAAFALPAPR